MDMVPKNTVFVGNVIQTITVKLAILIRFVKLVQKDQLFKLLQLQLVLKTHALFVMLIVLMILVQMDQVLVLEHLQMNAMLDSN